MGQFFGHPLPNIATDDRQPFLLAAIPVPDESDIRSKLWNCA